MFWSTKKTTRRARLNVSALERRDTPSTTLIRVGDTITVTGDGAADTVKVSILDATNSLQVSTSQGIFGFASSDIKTINVNLNGGDDNLTVQLGNGTESAVSLTRAKTINANLGDGNDNATMFFGGLGVPGRVIAANLNLIVHAGNGDDSVVGNFGEIQKALKFQTFMGNGNDDSFAGIWGTIDAGASAKIDFHGEAGNDSLNTFATYVNDYDQVDIGFGGLLDIGLNGGDGNDSLGTTYGGADHGKLKVREDGGNGNDHVTAELHLVTPKFFPLTFGTADVVLRGGSGFDGLELDVYGRARTHRFLIDGGSGFDHAKGTSNVTIVNANELGGIILNPPPGGIGNTL
ncbi:MAG TPA: hypothetical protein VHR66_32260 [Gemmataceae bacterium]|jgi:hypothetical protein|nr:hypothetical protein [Gemmataceae bacterium]